MASWYGAPYHNRRGSNGEIYDMNAMTAAHLTLPLGSIVRITNLKTRHSAVVRITDRGPFVEGRIVDLSLAAAKALDVYLPGTARFGSRYYKPPAALETGGRWAVQIGSFPDEQSCRRISGPFATPLPDRQSAKVSESRRRLVGAGARAERRPPARQDFSPRDATAEGPFPGPAGLRHLHCRHVSRRIDH